MIVGYNRTLLLEFFEVTFGQIFMVILGLADGDEKLEVDEVSDH